MLKPRYYQDGAVDGLFNYFENEDGNPIVIAPTGCHGILTDILMYDGSIKNVADVAVGDQLMGPDSKPRNVLRLHRGRDEMVIVEPKRGDGFVVNKGHILSLKRTNECKVRGVGKTTSPYDEISVSEYMGKTNWWKHVRKLWRTGVDFPDKATELPFDPYFVGLFLGDGSGVHGTVSLTTMDDELSDYWIAEVARMGMEVRKSSKPDNKASSYYIKFGEMNGPRGSAFRRSFEAADLYGKTAEHKFVPDAYKTSSMENRLALLAGLFDADGHLHNGTSFDYITASMRLAEDVTFMARSCGLWATMDACEKYCQTGGGGTYYRVYISGVVHNIPCKLPRKQGVNRPKQKDPLVTGFDLHEIGEGDYYGFELDGDHLYLTSDFVVHHNSGKSLMIAEFIRRICEEYPDAIIDVLSHVAKLLVQDCQKLIGQWPDAPCGFYSAGLGQKKIRSQILFAGIQSVYKHAYKRQRVDIVIIDEARLVSPSEGTRYKKYLSDLKIINPDIKICGFDASPWRLDQGMIYGPDDDMLFDGVAYEISIVELLKNGFLCPITTRRTAQELDTSGVGVRGGEFMPKALQDATDKEEVTRACVDEIVRLDERPGLLFATGVQHAYHIRDEIRTRGYRCEVIDGDTDERLRDRWIDDMCAGRLDYLSNCGTLTTGVDIPPLRMIGDLAPTKSPALHVQKLGRLMRLSPGKERGIVLDFARNVDEHGPIDLINPKPKGKAGTGEAPSKTCPECDTKCHASAKQCEECGHEFPPGEVKFTADAGKGAIISSQIEPEWLPVTAVSYSLHRKQGKPPSLKVTYQTGLTFHTEWVTLEHEGYARRKAESWWMARGPNPIPASVDLALTRKGELRKPSAIKVRKVGKYPEIMAARF